MAKWLLAVAWIVWITKWQCHWASRDDILTISSYAAKLAELLRKEYYLDIASYEL
jgi:hypothetical protein